jgi:glycosyltransferase involved in cell wall biosynthesis
MSVNENVLIFCGSRANKHKGIPTLIKAAKVLKYDYKINNFHIMYAGSGPDLDNFKQLANKLCVEDKFEFLGQLASTHDHACRSDIIVVPSEWGEGFGSTVVEGMAAGKVVVATRVGGIPEIVSRRDLGLLIEPGDDELLAKTLKTLINDPVSRNSYGINAKKWASKYFDESVYHSAVTERIMKDIGAAPNGKNS